MPLRKKEPRLFEVVIGEKESHAAAVGEYADFVEVLLGGAEIAGMAEVRGASQEGAGKMIKGTCAAES